MNKEKIEELKEEGFKVEEVDGITTILFSDYVTATIQGNKLHFKVDLTSIRDEQDSSDFDEDVEYYLLSGLREKVPAEGLVVTEDEIVFDGLVSEEKEEEILDVLSSYITEEGQA